MKIDPTIARRVNRMDREKGNRVKVVNTLPEKAEDGDMVMYKNQMHVMTTGFWKNIDDVVMTKLNELEKKLKELEEG